jgi:DNA invertase Pin-like site-specific DNA recombinase
VREGHTVIETVADYKSGTVAPWDRKNLRAWVTDPERLALYDGILAYKMDRLSRGAQEDFTRIEHWAAENRKRLVIVDGPQYPERPGTADRIVWPVLADQARKEWEAIRERTGRAQSALRAQGHLVGRWPFGYISEGEKYGRRLVPSNAGREYVPEIFARVADGEPLAAVADWLNAARVPTLQGKEWGRERLAAVIRNPVYKGRRTNREGITEHECEALVDAALWKRANDSLSDRPARRGSRKATVNPEPLLKGILRCPVCDGPMYRLFTGREGTSSYIAYYRCRGTGAVPKSACRNLVRTDAMDDLVSGFMASLDDEILARKIVEGTNHERELAENRDAMREAAARYIDDDAALDRELDRLRGERDRLRALPSVPDRVEMVPTGETYAARWESLLDADSRGKWLRSVGLRIWAIRASRVPSLSFWHDGHRIAAGMGADVGADKSGRLTVTVRNGILAAIEWNTSSLGELSLGYDFPGVTDA